MMGYDLMNHTVSVRLSNHGGERQLRDVDAFDRFREELRYLIDSDPDYRRIMPIDGKGRR